jgi:hypothetical protein
MLIYLLGRVLALEIMKVQVNDIVEGPLQVINGSKLA